ncbi:SARP family transcriptional regulator [Motilibacter rhizosphaerae]|uniref:SARP family transcriptional regulator n=1 Tax=Motilibacter rhizosphaerae TaxID=598652 RepID=A0A4Q7NRF1_9ACTN|nr:BTAD domain-containing putative transcriptional regulator [Motilibacter rhizosphaerae]RZS89637.1 SARP family transcriptional regulator [Motilibacter rhizosphaerae]
MQYSVLGPLEVREGGRVLDLGTPKQRAVLAALLLERGRVVSTDRLVAVAWGDEAPPSAVGSLQVYVSNLRRILRGGGARLERRNPGYVLLVDDADVDVAQFLAAAAAAYDAAAAAEWPGAQESAERALALWRGPLLPELADEDWVRAAALALEERRAECLETLVTALLAGGRVGEALERTQQLVSEDPYRERGRWLHLVALHRAGRTPEALEGYRAHARLLDEELGLVPGADLRELHAALLRDDDALREWPGAAPAPAGPPADGGEPAPALPAASGPAPVSGLVGREDECARMSAVLDDVLAGRTRWVLLSGPAGIGKTRLAEEALRAAVAAGAREAWVRCPEEEGVPSWWPLRQLVRALGAEPDDVLVPSPDIDADTARFVVYERVTALLQSAAADGPVVVVVDDVQWADRSSLRCLAYLCGVLRDLPLGLVLTLREGEGARDVDHLLATLVRSGVADRVAVPPLSECAVATLAAQVGGTDLAPDDAAVLASRTGGNPLFVTEYARLPADERGSGIPLAVRSILGRRLARLAPSVVEVLRAAAVIGDPFPLDLLEAVAGLPLDGVAEALELAAEDQIVAPARSGTGWAFSHALLRDEVLQGLPVLRRSRLHVRAATALESAAGSDALARRAGHLLAALPLVPAATVLAACREAAQDAEARWDADAAAQWWEAALSASAALGPAEREAAERESAGPDDLLVARVDALARAGRDQTVLEVVDSAIVEAAREGRTGTIGRLAAALLRTSGAWPWAAYGTAPGVLLDRLVEVTPLVGGDPAAHVRVLAARAVGSCYSPDAALPEGLSRRALELAEELGDPAVVADAIVGRVLTYTGTAAHAEEAVALLDRLVRLRTPHARTDAVLRHNVLTMACSTLGRTDEAEEHLRRGVAGCDLLGLPVPRVQLRWAEATLVHWSGRLEEAEALLSRADVMHRRTELYESGVLHLAMLTLRWEQGRLADAGEHVDGAPEPLPWQAAAAAERGDVEAALVLLERFVPEETPFFWSTLGVTVVVALALAEVADLGAPDDRVLPLARTLLARLEPYAGFVAILGQIGIIAPVELALSRMRALLGDEPGARSSALAALELAQRAGGPCSVLRARLQLALLDPASPQRTRMLAELAREADERSMRSVARQARAADEVLRAAAPA